MPDQAQCVPEDEVGVTAGGARVHLVCPVILGEGHLHKLGSVKRKREDSHGDDVDQKPLAVAHGLRKKRQCEVVNCIIVSVPNLCIIK